MIDKKKYKNIKKNQPIPAQSTSSSFASFQQNELKEIDNIRNDVIEPYESIVTYVEYDTKKHQENDFSSNSDSDYDDKSEQSEHEEKTDIIYDEMYSNNYTFISKINQNYNNISTKNNYEITEETYVSEDDV